MEKKLSSVPKSPTRRASVKVSRSAFSIQTPNKEPPPMFNVDEQTAHVENLYKQLVGTDPPRTDRPLAPIPPDANPEQYVQENLRRLHSVLQTHTTNPTTPVIPTFAPRVAVFDTEQEWKCIVELPGVRRENLSVQVTNGILHLMATRSLSGTNETTTSPMYLEIQPCRFERAIQLPLFTKCETGQTHLEHGFLTLTFQKDPVPNRKDMKLEVA